MPGVWRMAQGAGLHTVDCPVDARRRAPMNDAKRFEATTMAGTRIVIYARSVRAARKTAAAWENSTGIGVGRLRRVPENLAKVDVDRKPGE